MTLVQKKSCGILFFHRPAADAPLSFLVLRRRNSDTWEFPKGTMEPGEDEIECARREMDEECGIREFHLETGFRDTIHYQKKKCGADIAKAVVFFLARVDDRRVRLSDEHSAFLWGGAERIGVLLKRDAQRALLQRVLDFLDTEGSAGRHG